MNRRVDSILFKARSALCIAVTMATPLALIGCGAAPAVSMPLGAQNEVFQKLMGTPYAGAKSIDIDPANHAFRINSADPGAWLSGTYSASGSGPAYVSSLTLVSAGQVATFNFNSAKEITSIVNSRGTWERPASTGGAATSPTARSQSDVDEYVAANSELLAQAREADEQLAQGQLAAPSDQTKLADQSLSPIFWVLAGVAIGAAGVVMSIIWVVEVVALLNAIF